MTGKNRIKTIFVTLYWPVSSPSPGSIYAQHLIYMTESKDKILDGIECSCQLFGHNLKELISYKLTLCH